MKKIFSIILILTIIVIISGCNKGKTIEETPKENIPEIYQDNGIFKDYYEESYKLLNNLSLEEKIGQLLLVRHTDNALEVQSKYQFGGFIFYEKDFINKTKEELTTMIKELQSISHIPLLTAIDEEGGKVSRLSSNPALVNEPFKSPQELYKINGFKTIKEDVINKSKILKELGLNLNLAPVVDVSTNESDYIYPRTLGLSTNKVNEYAKVVIKTSKDTGVSYTLKHFPGYGNNLDTHKETSTDIKSKEEIFAYDIPPFKEGIKAGAESILVSHNIVASIDSENPASLSKNINNILRNDLKFTGVIITDDLSMKATKDIENPEIKALLAGNNILITTEYEKSFQNILEAFNEELITEEELNKLVFKVLAWKYYKGLF